MTIYQHCYLGKKYWLYKDYPEGKKRLLGKFSKVSDVDNALKRH